MFSNGLFFSAGYISDGVGLTSDLFFQSVLFLKPGDKNKNDSGGTLSGNKRLVYVLMKILKKCYEDVNITSFKVVY